MKTVQELLGHSKYDMTADIYSHVSPELKRDAVSALNGTLRSKKKPSKAEGRSDQFTVREKPGGYYILAPRSGASCSKNCSKAAG